MHHHGNSALSNVGFQNLFHNLQAEDMSFCEASQYHSLLCKTLFSIVLSCSENSEASKYGLKVIQCIH